jgi:uncharacterized protein Yka (UPF0111/DUF47 family)
MRKDKILSELQEEAFHKYEHLRAGLAANDRAKYFFALVGLAQSQAFTPQSAPDDLKSEREKVGVEDAWLDAVVSQARSEGEVVVLPRGKEVLERAAHEVKAMVKAVSACGAPEAGQFARRFRLIEEELAHVKDARIPATLIGRMLSGERTHGDGLHLLVMDAHKVLNRLGSELAEEKIDGAAVYGIEPDDRELVAAFMRGVNRTSPLRFDHPGLDTTATRMKTQLLIQNDIGETDAHVFLCTVRPGAVEITYTDVHEKRADFFQSMLVALEPRWEARAIKQAKDLPESSDYFLVRGTITWQDRARLTTVLTEIGAKLAFLIDWNKARKALRTFAKGDDAVDILAWSSKEELGHMAFLKLGGRELVYEALELLEPGTIRAGEPLYSVLGDEATLAFLRDTLRITSLGLRGNESELLIRDRVKAAFVRYFRTLARGPLMSCRDLSALVVEGALTVRDMLRALARGDREFVARSARRLHIWEEESDVILNRIRKASRARPGRTDTLSPAQFVDDAQDAFEEAAHLLALIVPEKLPEQLRFDLEEAADLCVRAAQEGYKAVASAEEAFEEAMALEDFSHSIDRLDSISHQAEQLRREFRQKLLAGPELGSAFAMLVKDCADELTKAAESLARAGFALHGTVFEHPAGR